MKIKAGNDERVWLFFRNIILIGGLLLILCPLWMVLINSFKTLEEAGKNFFALPSKLNLENYIELFTNSNYWIFLKNSFKITVITIILILIFVPSVSYSIAFGSTFQFLLFIFQDLFADIAKSLLFSLFRQHLQQMSQ